MTNEMNPLQSFDKIGRGYTECREQEIAVRVSFDVAGQSACTSVSFGQTGRVDS